MTRLLVQRSEASSAAWPIVNSSMNPVAVATPPQAHDANGNPVPVTASVNGNTLTLHVPHTTGDWAYPIVVDPLWGFLGRRSAQGAIVGWLTVGGWRGAIGGCLAAAWKL